MAISALVRKASQKLACLLINSKQHILSGIWLKRATSILITVTRLDLESGAQMRKNIQAVILLYKRKS